MSEIILPDKDEKDLAREARNARIRKLAAKGYTLREICVSENVSRTAAFFAIQGRKPQKLKTKNHKPKNNV